jgi:hypothetical protein
MWSHYADKHQGICFVFSSGLADGIDDVNDIACVHYLDGSAQHQYDKWLTKVKEEKIYDVTSDDYLYGVELSKEALAYKHKDWSYEQEVRFIASSQGARNFHAGDLEIVYLGLKISEISRSQILDLIHDEKWANVLVLQAKRGRAALELDFEIVAG